MFGYVIVNKELLSEEDLGIYQSTYCGVCNSLKQICGLKGQISLNYDAAFLALILTGLYDEKTTDICKRCVAHPSKKRIMYSNNAIDYSALLSIYLTYYKCADDWQDDKNVIKLIYSKSLNKHINKIESIYPDKCNKIKKYLENLSQCEKSGETDIDKVSGLFGHIMEEIYDYSDDIWQESLKKIGFYLGKFIYIIDAYDDLTKDIKHNDYNVLKSLFEKCDNDLEKFGLECKNMLKLMLAQISNELEKLPIIENMSVIRNIIYSGIWCRFNG